MPPFIGKLALVENASSARSDEGSKERCEKRYAKLNYCALKVSQDHVVALFRREYLDALLSYENPPEACTLLIKCVDAYERIQKLEETLDKMHFTELLRKGCMGMLRYGNFSKMAVVRFRFFLYILATINLGRNPYAIREHFPVPPLATVALVGELQF